jgi:hypothetical protein
VLRLTRAALGAAHGAEKIEREVSSYYLLKVDRMRNVPMLPAAMGAVQPSVVDGSPFVLLAG